jgi:hypothetical protein
MATTVSLTRAEFKVLLRRLNTLADLGQVNEVIVEGDDLTIAPIRPLIRKLVKAGLRSRDLRLPACFRKGI